MELAKDHRIKIHLDDWLFGGDPGVIAEAGAKDQQTVALVHYPAGHRGAAAPEDTGREGVAVGDESLALEGRDDRATQHLGKLDHTRHLEAAAVTDNDNWPLGPGEQLHRPIDRLLGRGDLEWSDPALGSTSLRPVVCGHLGHLVWENDLRDAAVEDGALAREVDELGMLAVREGGLLPLRHLSKSSLQINLLESTRPEDLGLNLSSQRDHRRAIDIGVPQPGQKICRAGAGNRQAGGRAPGQFAVCRTGEGRRTFMANSVVTDVALLLLDSKSIGESEI